MIIRGGSINLNFVFRKQSRAQEDVLGTVGAAMQITLLWRTTNATTRSSDHRHTARRPVSLLRAVSCPPSRDPFGLSVGW